MAASGEPRTISVVGDGSDTLSYVLPGRDEFEVESVVADYDTSAGEPTPLLQVVSATGQVIAEKPQADSLGIGGTGRATWALRLADDGGGGKLEVSDLLTAVPGVDWLAFHSGAVVTPGAVGQAVVDITAPPAVRQVPRFLQAARPAQALASGAVYAPAGPWTIVTNDITGAIQTPAGAWTGSHFKVTANLDGTTTLRVRHDVANDAWYHFATQATVDAFLADPAPGSYQFTAGLQVGAGVGNFLQYTGGGGAGGGFIFPWAASPPIPIVPAATSPRRWSAYSQGMAYRPVAAPLFDEVFLPGAFQQSGQTAQVALTFYVVAFSDW